MRAGAALVVALAALMPAGAAAQTVRVTPADLSAARQMVFYKPSGPYRIVNYSVRELVRFAYSLPDTHIIGLPAWADAERFDIEQQFDSEPTSGEVQAIVRDLLSLQFGFTTHVEKREFPGYGLVRSGASLGPLLRPSPVDCERQPATGAAGVTPCQLRLGEQGIYGVGMTMAQFAFETAGSGYVRVDRPVIDRTGMTGTYDFEITLMRMQRTPPGPNGELRISSVRSSDPLPVLLERELGLRLEEQPVPADVLVVDRVTPPALAPPPPPVRAPALRVAFAVAQTPSPEPTFEVASIKRNVSGDEMFSMVPAPGGRLTLTNVPLRLVIRAAYNLQEFELSGGPSWIDAERYDILTKAAGNPGTQELVAMLQTLLADRFQLQLSEVATERPIYTLVAARPAGAPGPGLRPAQPCFRAPVNQPQAVPPGETACGFRNSPGFIAGRGVTLRAFTFGLSSRVERVVEDRTGIDGEFDFDLTFAPDLNSDGASLFTALEEQLGIKLEPAVGTARVMRIERVERPTEN